jgi:hypothetical protein
VGAVQLVSHMATIVVMAIKRNRDWFLIVFSSYIVALRKQYYDVMEQKFVPSYNRILIAYGIGGFLVAFLIKSVLPIT